MAKTSRPRHVPPAGRPYMPGYSMMFEKGRESLSWAWAQKRLSDSHNYWLISSRPDGRPHSMPVWGIWLDRSFFFCTGRQSRKFKNLEVSPYCVVCPDGAGEAVILEGVAEANSDRSLFRRFARVYKKKYDYDLTDTKDPVYRVRPRLVFGFVETPSKTRGNPTRWQFRGDPSSKGSASSHHALPEK